MMPFHSLNMRDHPRGGSPDPSLVNILPLLRDTYILLPFFTAQQQSIAKNGLKRERGTRQERTNISTPNM